MKNQARVLTFRTYSTPVDTFSYAACCAQMVPVPYQVRGLFLSRRATVHLYSTQLRVQHCFHTSSLAKVLLSSEKLDEFIIVHPSQRGNPEFSTPPPSETKLLTAGDNSAGAEGQASARRAFSPLMDLSFAAFALSLGLGIIVLASIGTFLAEIIPDVIPAVPALFAAAVASIWVVAALVLNFLYQSTREKPSPGPRKDGNPSAKA